MHCVRWTPDDGASSAKGLVLILHGGAEHCGRYTAIATELTSLGLVVVSHDHRGHGKSEGSRLYVDTFDEYVQDALMHLKILQQDYARLPIFLLGHSMGATVSLGLLLKHLDEVPVRGMVFIAPAFMSTQKSVPAYKVSMARLASKLYPQMQVAPIEPGWMSRDPAVLKDYKEDPLVYHGGVKARWGLAYLDMLAEVKGKWKDVRTPFLTIHGTGDNLWSSKGSELFHEEAASEDKNIRLFDGAYHQVHHEPDGVGSECIKSLSSWIQQRVEYPL